MTAARGELNFHSLSIYERVAWSQR